MSLRYLWSNRIRPPVFTHAWFKAWAKRAFNSFDLIAILIKGQVFRLKGAVIGDLAILEKVDVRGSAKKLSIGIRTFIGRDVHIALHHTVTIGNNVVINEGVRILTGSHDTQCSKWSLIAKPITIGDYAWIAVGAVILPGVAIGKGAVVGAGAVVSKDVADYEIVTGNPASKVGLRNTLLDYSPVNFCSAFEAWLGKEEK